jgi:hypothetical protein
VKRCDLASVRPRRTVRDDQAVAAGNLEARVVREHDRRVHEPQS